MGKKGVKEKQVYRNKDELVAELKKSDEFQKKMKFAREVFYPALCNATESIDEAQMFLSGFSTMLMQSYIARMKDIKMSELNLASLLSETNPGQKDLVALFNDMSLFDAKDSIDGMRSEIGVFLSDEQKKRPLSTLTTKWIDEL